MLGLTNIRQILAGLRMRKGPTRTWHSLGSFPTRSSIRVTPEKALQLSTVMACVRLLSETIGSLPLHVYRRDGDSRFKAVEHPLYWLLHGQPNRWQTPIEYWEMMMGHLCLRGNAYSRIVYDRKTWAPAALLPIHPDRVKIESTPDGNRRYVITTPISNQIEKVRPELIFHIRGLSSDGVMGLSPIQYAAESMGLALAAEGTAGAFFRNNAILGAALEHPKNLTKPAQRRLRESLQEEYSGPDNAYQLYVLEEGMKWHQMGVSPAEGQFLETRKFQALDIARIFRVPPHMVGHLDKATFNNIEHQSIDFVIYSIRAWLVRIEQAIQRDLFAVEDRGKFYAKFLVDGLLRGDSIKRAQALKIQFQHGALNRDEWRSIEDRNPIPDGSGKKFYVPLNMVEGTGGSGGDNDRAEDRSLPRGALTAWVDSTVDRIVGAELRAVDRWMSRAAHSSSFSVWLESFYAKHAGYVTEAVGPIFTALEQGDSLSAAVTGIIDVALEAYAGRDPIAVRAEITNGRHSQIRNIIVGHICEVQDAV